MPRARRALEADLRRVPAQEQFETFYQPLEEVRAGPLAGFEAPIRWSRPARGLVPAAEFIPVAEGIGLIRPMGAWALHRVCADTAGWPTSVSVAVDLSAVQFTGGDLVCDVERASAASGRRRTAWSSRKTESVRRAPGPLVQQPPSVAGGAGHHRAPCGGDGGARPGARVRANSRARVNQWRGR